MIINHNLPAMNTYRQYNNNNTQVNKSLEKLSSGLRINRAGDDAAGLAISEKMRGQIRGLDQASRNSQDGISMIQTAEGALNETHSILQRMRELAVQAANDTNVGVDRNEIQKEINQLTSEINRIGNTTEFNTQKLLNGSEVKLDVNTVTQGAAKGSLNGITTNGSVTAAGQTTGVKAVAAVWTATIAATGGTVTAGMTISFNGVNVTFVTGATGDAAVNEKGVVKFQTTATTTNITEAIADAFNYLKTDGTDAQKAALKDFTFSVDADVHLTVTGKADDGTKYNESAKLEGTVTGATGALSTTGVDAVYGQSTFTIDSAFENAGATIKIADVTLKASQDGAGKDEFKIGSSAREQAENIVIALNKNATFTAGYSAVADGNKIIIRNNVADAGTTVASGAIVTTATIGANEATQGKYSFSMDTLMAVGGKYEINGQIIKVTDDINDAGLKNGTAVLYDSDKEGQASKLANAINLNDSLKEMFGNVKVDGKVITLTQKQGHESMITPEVIDGSSATGEFVAKLQIGANSGQSMTITLGDMRAEALGIAGTNPDNIDAVASNGVKASFTRTANVTNGTDNTNVEYALDVSTHEKATAAVSVINDAIESVSSERSKLGAFQNRLEHTINNLGTTSENLSAAESRIRDVDMAKEMMNYQKNTVLAQAAQAMLAQANQQPQGVLQLLR